MDTRKLILTCFIIISFIPKVYAGDHNDYGVYLTDVDNPATIENILKEISAMDENGDRTDDIIVINDNYSNSDKTVGDYEVSLGFMDKNIIKTTVIIVRVCDISPPIIIFDTDFETKITPTSNYQPNNLSCIDNLDYCEIIISNIDSLNSIGTYEVSFIAKDSSNNYSDTYIKTIQVIDIKPPVISGPIYIMEKSLQEKLDYNEYLIKYFNITDEDTNLHITVNEANNSLNEIELRIIATDSSNNHTSFTTFVLKSDSSMVITETEIILQQNNSLEISSILDTIKTIPAYSDIKSYDVMEDNGIYKLNITYYNKSKYETKEFLLTNYTVKHQSIFKEYMSTSNIIKTSILLFFTLTLIIKSISKKK